MGSMSSYLGDIEEKLKEVNTCVAVTHRVDDFVL